MSNVLQRLNGAFPVLNWIVAWMAERKAIERKNELRRGLVDDAFALEDKAQDLMFRRGPCVQCGLHTDEYPHADHCPVMVAVRILLQRADTLRERIAALDAEPPEPEARP